MNARSRIVVAVHRLLLRTSATPLGRAWALGYRALARGWGAYLTRGEREPSTYVRAGSSDGDLVPGLSDVDVAIVLGADPAGPGRARARATRRWERLHRSVPASGLLLDHPRIYEEPELAGLAGATAFTYGLDAGRAAYFGAPAALDAIRLLERPGLYGTTSDWRLVSGPERRPREPARDPQLRRIAAWLELVHWWRWAIPVCVDPSGPRTAHLCVKLVAEPARIWLWLAHGERAASRPDALRAALRRLPEEEEALRGALDLWRALPAAPAPPLHEVLPALVRLSARIAALIAAELRDEGATAVRLAGDPAELVLPHGRWRPREGLAGGRDPRLLPLCDWRALATPRLLDESFAPLPGDPGDPAVLGAAADELPGPCPAFRVGGLLVLPVLPWARTRLRAVHCAATDPVSFALLDGARVAAFPAVAGWSARDTARRAVAEHAAILRGGAMPGDSAGSLDSGGLALARTLSAARAALLLESVEDGDPELLLTASATARRLAERVSARRGVVEDAMERCREFARHRTPPPAPTLAALRAVVLGLPAYRARSAPPGPSPVRETAGSRRPAPRA